MKTKKIASYAILAVVLFFNANLASAECAYGCPVGGSFSPPPPSHSSPVIPQPIHQQPATFSIKGNGSHQGIGSGFAKGDQGFAKTELGGGTNLNTTLNASGNLCPGTNCTSGSYSFQGSSWQATNTSAGALSNGGNSVAAAGNSGSANVGLNFTKQ